MKKSVIEKLESWLQRGYGITQLQALEKWGCMRLSARIDELRKNGIPIITTTIKENGKSFAKYTIRKQSESRVSEDFVDKAIREYNERRGA